ncbi:transposon TX1 [Tanacetum coccineum]
MKIFLKDSLSEDPNTPYPSGRVTSIRACTHQRPQRNKDQYARRLRNGKRYGFVRFKLVSDVDALKGQLQKIKIGEEWLRVYVAFDRRNNRYEGLRACDEGIAGKDRNGDMNWKKGKEVNMSTCDNRRYIDVINGESKINKTKKNVDNNYGIRSNHGNSGYKDKDLSDHGNERTIEVNVNDVNKELLGRSVVGEVKALCFLTKLPALCEEQGLNNIEVKLLGGLEVMIVMENEETTNNVMEDMSHGLRR